MEKRRDVEPVLIREREKRHTYRETNWNHLRYWSKTWCKTTHPTRDGETRR